MNQTSALELEGAHCVRDRLSSPMELDQSNSLNSPNQFSNQCKQSVASNWNQALTRKVQSLFPLRLPHPVLITQTNPCGPAFWAALFEARAQRAAENTYLVLVLDTSFCIFQRYFYYFRRALTLGEPHGCWI